MHSQANAGVAAASTAVAKTNRWVTAKARGFISRCNCMRTEEAAMSAFHAAARLGYETRTRTYCLRPLSLSNQER